MEKWNIIRKIKNWLGDSKGYGHCSICGDSWSWKTPHHIQLNDHTSAFPFCEECETKASNKQKMDAAIKLAEKWLTQSPAHHYKQTKKDARFLIKKAKELYQI